MILYKIGYGDRLPNSTFYCVRGAGGGVWFPKYKPLPIHTEAHMSRPADLPLWGKKISNHISASLFSYLTYIFPKWTQKQQIQIIIIFLKEMKTWMRPLTGGLPVTFASYAVGVESSRKEGSYKWYWQWFRNIFKKYSINY